MAMGNCKKCGKPFKSGQFAVPVYAVAEDRVQGTFPAATGQYIHLKHIGAYGG